MSGILGNTENEDGVIGTTAADDKSGVFGRANSKGWGVFGLSEQGFAGVFGSGGQNGVYGQTNNGNASGVHGRNDGNNLTGSWGVFGFSKNGFAGVFGSGAQNGVFGQTNNKSASGVYGRNDGNGNGVLGSSDGGNGIGGFSKNLNGVYGQSEAGSGLHGYSKQQFGIYAYSDTGMAGYFEGSITVTNDLILKNADCAEDFDIVGLGQVEPGTVMVIDSEGALRESDKAYDRCVAGVISGAGNYKPGIVLDKQKSSKNRMPIALMGKVYCKVDASYGAIEVGDLLTTSPTAGHAMKVTDPLKAFGSVIGKALRSIDEGQGLIPILIALQ